VLSHDLGVGRFIKRPVQCVIEVDAVAEIDDPTGRAPSRKEAGRSWQALVDGERASLPDVKADIVYRGEVGRRDSEVASA
jgi:hypothetical protein